jgi:biotin synthase
MGTGHSANVGQVVFPTLNGLREHDRRSAVGLARVQPEPRDWKELGRSVLDGYRLSADEAMAVLLSGDDELLDVLAGAFILRRAYFGMEVRLHLIRNARSGGCGEDCGFCAQSREAAGIVPEHPLQCTEEIVAGARDAARLGAFRYCIVTSGRHAEPGDLERLCEAARTVKRETSLEVCTSLGLLDEAAARRLREAGVDRYNHNLETSERFFPEVCSTHGYEERVETARVVKRVGLALCSGGIIGMGETLEDRVAMAFAAAEVGADSVPVNFFDPRPGTPFAGQPRPSPADCLRALAMFRFVCPNTEVRAAGGREVCLGPLQALALYPANSIFTNGYLTTSGQGHADDLSMIRAAGFELGGLVQG